MFDLNKDLVRLANINTRSEKHGDDDVLALDIKCEANMANAVLSKFSPTLKSCLYEKDPGAQEDMINPDHMPKLRNPAMGAIKWELEMPSIQFRIHHGEDDTLDLVFSGTKANKFQFQCQEGGTVIVGFRVQVSEPDEADVARLLSMLNKSVKVTLFNEMSDEHEDLKQESSDKVQDLFEGSQQDAQENDSTEAVSDDLYDQAVALVRREGLATISLVQRHLQIGYNRAARLLEEMEAHAIVGPMQSDMSREVLPEANSGSDKNSEGNDDSASDDYDQLYAKAVEIVRQNERISITSLKRETKLSSLTATRLLEQMETEGIVGPAAGNGVREALKVNA